MTQPSTDLPQSSAPNAIWPLLKESVPPPAAGRWLRWHPGEIEDCLAARAARLPEPLTAEELIELREAHHHWGADAVSLAALERLADPAARVVVTGQQPALLAGPLLVVYKTMAAIDLARRLGERHPGLHFIPVFWVASEDHDFDEIRRVYWPGHGGQFEEFLLPQNAWKWGQMIGRIPTATMLENLKDQINNSTFKTEFGPDIIRLLDEIYGGEATLESGFCRLLMRLFAGSGLVIVSPLAHWVRRRAAAILSAEFSDPGASTREIIARGKALESAAITPSLHRPPQSLNAFWLDGEGRRHTLRLEGTEVQRALPQNDEGPHIDQPPVSVEELLRLLQSDPEHFSTNVVTRPLVQDAILPTVAQVIGPGEAAYLAQVEAVYERFGVFAPVRWPRPQITLVEPRVARNMEKYRVELEAAMEGETDALVKAIIRRDLETTDMQDVEQIRQHQFGEVDELRKKFGAANSAIDSAFDKLLQAMGKGYGKIIERILYQRQQDERSLNQAVALILNSLRPNGQPQERLLNPIVPYAINYGLDWVARLTPHVVNDPTAPMQIFQLTELVKTTAPAAFTAQ